MIAYKFLTNPIVIDNGIYTLVLENKELYRNTIVSLLNDKGSDLFVISENYNPYDFNKNTYFINDILSFDVSDKKLMTKVNADLTKTANDLYYEELISAKSLILEFAEKLAFEFDYDFSFNEDIDATAIIKMLNYKVRDESESVLDSFLLMIKLLKKYTKIKLIICCNLSLYFLKSEILALTEMVKAMDIKILNIENYFSDSFEKNNVLIIDNDLCEIIDNK